MCLEPTLRGQGSSILGPPWLRAHIFLWLQGQGVLGLQHRAEGLERMAAAHGGLALQLRNTDLGEPTSCIAFL